MDRLTTIRAAVPAEGLFADKDWLISPEPFSITADLDEQLQKLGYRLGLFNRACNELYQRSVSGKQPAWIADYLDRGKPPELVELWGQAAFEYDLPAMTATDNLLHPTHCVQQAQELAGEVFGAAATFYLGGGATTGIAAMITLP